MQSSAPSVSVVLPTRNRAALTRLAVESVLAQTYTDLELIVVDDGSTDDTPACLAALDDPRLVQIRLQRPRGGGGARNVGLERARGEWIAFQDSDDRWLPDKLTRQLEALTAARHADPRFAAVFCRYRRDGEIVPAAPAASLHGELLPALARRSLIGTPTLLVHRDVLGVGGFDAALPRFQDWEWVLRIATRHHIAFVDDVLVEAGPAGQGITAGHDRKLLEAERRILERHRGLFEGLGPDVLAYRLWHLGHVHCMAGEMREGRRWLREAAQARASWRDPLFRLLAANRRLYSSCYAAFRAFV